MLRAALLGEDLERFQEIDLPDFEPLTLRFIGDLFQVVREEKRQREEWEEEQEELAESGGGRNWNETPLDY